MHVRIKFLGGAQSVTGSKYLLEINQQKILIDCGLFQGLKNLRLRNWDDFPVDPTKIDLIIITHAHLDHSGYLPRLVKQGYQGPVYCTYATADLLEILWADAAKLQEEDADFAKEKGFSKHKNPLPLYTQKDVLNTLPLIKSFDFKQEINLGEKASFEFIPAGHILGASSIRLNLRGDNQNKTLLFSGDIGRTNDPILFPPKAFKKPDILLLESTYGDRTNDNSATQEELKSQINKTVEDGVVLIPAFTVGRTQNILYYLHELMEKGEIPKIPVYIDSPMAISVTNLYKKYSEQHKLERNEVFDYPQFHYINDHQDSKALDNLKKKGYYYFCKWNANRGKNIKSFI